jgi:hypothetical protein
MDATHKIEAQPTIKRSLLKDLGALLLFVAVAGMAAMPCLCVTGAIAGRYKLALFFLVSLRLGWSIYRRTFRFRDYWIYFAIVMAFCIWMDFNY